MRQRMKRGCGVALLAIAALFVAVLAVMYFQAQREPKGRLTYVALGSSFAAGAGLGELQSGSPLACARSVGGYPPRLARILHTGIVDMSCGGAVTDHLLHGGQFFQGPQIRAIGRGTRLVTITIGGNDIGYIGDLSMLAARNSGSLFGKGVGWFWPGPRSEQQRGYADVEHKLVALVAAIRQRAPAARVVIATYPAIIPQQGACAVLDLSSDQAAMMRAVGDRLAAVTRSAAEQSGATLVDMNALGEGHDACAAQPWVRGWTNGGIAPFHPTELGAEATARAIARALGSSPN